MSLSFVETMRGWMTDDDGHTHPISFGVHATKVGPNELRLLGLIAAPPFVTEGVLEGSLSIELGALRYRLQLSSLCGDRFALECSKRLSPLHPVRSLTTMSAVLRDHRGRAVAVGTMHFDVRDLGAFAASWLPLSGRARKSLDAERRVLERRMLGTLPGEANARSSATRREEVDALELDQRRRDQVDGQRVVWLDRLVRPLSEVVRRP